MLRWAPECSRRRAQPLGGNGRLDQNQDGTQSRPITQKTFPAPRPALHGPEHPPVGSEQPRSRPGLPGRGPGSPWTHLGSELRGGRRCCPAGLGKDVAGAGGPGALMCFTPPHARTPATVSSEVAPAWVYLLKMWYVF